MIYFIPPGIALLAILVWLIWEFRRAPLQEDPHDREQFAQGSLGKCVNHPWRWAVIIVGPEDLKRGAWRPLCGECVSDKKSSD